MAHHDDSIKASRDMSLIERVSSEVQRSAEFKEAFELYRKMTDQRIAHLERVVGDSYADQPKAMDEPAEYAELRR